MTGVRVNLLPWRQRQRRRRYGYRIACVLLIGAALLAGAMAWRLILQRQSQALALDKQHAQTTLGQLTQQVAQARAWQLRLHKGLRQKQERMQRQAVAHRLVTQLREVAGSLPPQVWLVRLEWASGCLRLEGEAQSLWQLTQWQRQLAHKPGSVRLANLQQRDRQPAIFRLEMEARP